MRAGFTNFQVSVHLKPPFCTIFQRSLAEDILCNFFSDQNNKVLVALRALATSAKRQP